MVTEVRRIDLGTVELTIAEAGHGGHPLMLVHGWTGAKEDFADWMEPWLTVTSTWSLLTIVDTGRHPNPLPRATTHSNSLPTTSWRWQMPWRGTGSCCWAIPMGGMVAQVVAVRDPGRLRGLVLMDTHYGAIDVDPAIVDAGIDMARSNGIDAIADLMAVATEPGPLDSEAYRRVCAERPGHFQSGIDKTRRSSAAHVRRHAG